MIKRFFKRCITPAGAFHYAGRWLPWFVALSLLGFSLGLIDGLFIAPPDYQQGDTYRIMYIHVPSSLLAMTIYVMMAVWAVMSWVWRIQMAATALRVSARIGIWMTLLGLISGSLWGKPMWGTYWVWDARLTSMLILLFLYIGIIALQQAIPDHKVGDRAGALLAIIGVINIPIIHYSVQWWQTLHQGSSFTLTNSTIAPSMLIPLIMMLIAFFSYYGWLLCLGMRCEILKHYGHTKWLQEVL